MRLITQLDRSGGYDAVVVGSGFGALFFLKKFLQRRPRARALILEWGAHHTHQWQLENHRNAALDQTNAIDNRSPDKPWLFSIALGGGTNCWWGLTPRLHPHDFELKTRYGVGVDWPISYNDLASYYGEAERIMLIAGPDDMGRAYPGAGNYPMPHHNLSTVDRMLKAAMPEKHFAIPSARLRHPVGSRGACCATGQCNLCPVEAKFTALNALDDLLSDPRVDIMIGAKVDRLDIQAGVARGAVFTKDGREQVARGDLIVLGANALYSPWIMLRSSLGGHGLGRYLCEKRYVHAEVKLRGLKHFDGGTGTTGFNLTHLDGEHRRDRGAALILIENRMMDGLRSEWGRWREVLPISAYVEDIPSEANGIRADGDLVITEPFTWSDYAVKGGDAFIAGLPDLLSALPVESIRMVNVGTSSHIQCTTRMGRTRDDFVVDSNLIHHDVRNLIVVGNSVFPTVGTANPSLTCAALSLRAADRLTRSAA